MRKDERGIDTEGACKTLWGGDTWGQSLSSFLDSGKAVRLVWQPLEVRALEGAVLNKYNSDEYGMKGIRSLRAGVQ